MPESGSCPVPRGADAIPLECLATATCRGGGADGGVALAGLVERAVALVAEKADVVLGILAEADVHLPGGHSRHVAVGAGTVPDVAPGADQAGLGRECFLVPLYDRRGPDEKIVPQLNVAEILGR